jgi:hypothetical protein
LRPRHPAFYHTQPWPQAGFRQAGAIPSMNEPRKVDVAYTDGPWLAEVAPDYDEPIDCGTFQELIDAVQKDWPDQALVFVVDHSTTEGYEVAETQLLEASEIERRARYFIGAGILNAMRA